MKKVPVLMENLQSLQEQEQVESMAEFLSEMLELEYSAVVEMEMMPHPLPLLGTCPPWLLSRPLPCPWCIWFVRQLTRQCLGSQ